MSRSLVPRRESSWEALGGDFVSDSRRLRLRSRLASWTAAQSLSSDKVVKLMELLQLPTFSCVSDGGSSRSITMGAGGYTWVARLLAFAGMASLNSSCCVHNTNQSCVRYKESPWYSGLGSNILIVIYVTFYIWTQLADSLGQFDISNTF